jgi:uncharacterized protein
MTPVPVDLVYVRVMSVTFDPAVLAALQEHDSLLAQLHHRTSHLPTDGEIADVDTNLANVARSVAEARSAVEKLGARQGDFESKIHEIDTKVDAAAKTLYSGTVTATRELQALEADIASLKKHRSDLEDHEMEILLEREPLDAAIATADAKTAELQHQRAALVVRAEEERGALRVQAAQIFGERETLAKDLDPAALEIYERVRKNNKGVGAAKLEHGTCMGCRMKLSAVDMDRIRHEPENVVVQCEECSAILIR